MSVPVRRRLRSQARKVLNFPEFAWREATAGSRFLPHFVIIGAQRAGTSSLYRWLCSQPSVEPALSKEVQFFDVNYDKGERWYKAHFPVARAGVVTGEASPYMLFHPLAPSRAVRDLPDETKFIILLREPVSRLISQYWHEKNAGFETETFERAIALEPDRLRGTDDIVRRGERSFTHRHHSYVARSEYAGQLQRWTDAVLPGRLLVLESEKLFREPSVTESLLDWLGLPANREPFPAVNAAVRTADLDEQLVSDLRDHFDEKNEELFELLGTKLWID
jgi:hypothetical protein